jgi:Domain of unknown function (DUF4136)
MSVSPAPFARAALLLAALGAGGCAAATVSSYVDPSVELQRYRTFDWGPADASSTGDPRLDNNELFDHRVRMQVEAELARRGFEKSTSHTPDLLVHYHANVTQQIDVRMLDRDYRASDVAQYEPYVFDAGTLFVDLVDPRTNQLVWRGWTESGLAALIDDQLWLEKRIDEAVARILDRLPPRLY